MGIVLDLIIVAIISITALISAKKGFVKVVVEIAGLVAAVIVAFTLSTPLANLTYDKLIEPPIVKGVTASVDHVATESIDKTVDSVFEAMPKFIKPTAEKIGLSKENIINAVPENLSDNVEEAVVSISQSAIKPIVSNIFRMIYMIILMIILIIVVKILAKLLNKIFSFSIVGKLNKTLGGIIGIPKGIIIAMIFAFAVLLIVSFTENGFLIFTKDAVEGSFIFKLIPMNFFK